MKKRVLVFKTNVSRHREVDCLRSALDQLVNENDNWNFDLEDCDNILRFETNSLASHDISSALLVNGHDCQELPD